MGKSKTVIRAHITATRTGLGGTSLPLVTDELQKKWPGKKKGG